MIVATILLVLALCLFVYYATRKGEPFFLGMGLAVLVLAEIFYHLAGTYHQIP